MHVECQIYHFSSFRYKLVSKDLSQKIDTKRERFEEKKKWRGGKKCGAKLVVECEAWGTGGRGQNEDKKEC